MVSEVSDSFCTDLQLETWSAHTLTSVQVNSKELGVQVGGEP